MHGILPQKQCARSSSSSSFLLPIRLSRSILTSFRSTLPYTAAFLLIDLPLFELIFLVRALAWNLHRSERRVETFARVESIRLIARDLVNSQLKDRWNFGHRAQLLKLLNFYKNVEDTRQRGCVFTP